MCIRMISAAQLHVERWRKTVGTAILAASGKGGTGKTSVTAGVASCVAVLGHRTLCIDVDVGLRNLDLSLAMSDRAVMDFSDVMEERCSLEKAAAAHPDMPNLHLLTAPLSFRPHGQTLEQWRRMMAEAKCSFDYVFLDAPAGLGIGFELARIGADRGMIVSTSDANALRDASRCIGKLGDMRTLHLVMNRVSPKLMRQLHTTIDEAMDQAGLPLLGVVPEDEAVTLAAAAGKPLVLYTKDGASCACVNIAKRILGIKTPLMKMK